MPHLVARESATGLPVPILREKPDLLLLNVPLVLLFGRMWRSRL